MARPSKFTADRRKRFLLALGTGVFPETAARHAGWSPATLYRILAGSSAEHTAFRDEVRWAETELEIRLAGTVTMAAFGDARLALALLERRFSERWGRQARLMLPHEPDAERSRGNEVLVLDPAFVDAVVPKLLAARNNPASSATGDLARASRFEDRGTRPDEDDA